MSEQEHPGIAEVRAALVAAVGAADGILVLDDAVRTAAPAVGAEAGAIANSLLFLADSEPLLVLTSRVHRADTARVAGLVGARKLRKADPDVARVHTGQVIGGVSPLGHPKPIRTLVDEHPAVVAAEQRTGART